MPTPGPKKPSKNPSPRKAVPAKTWRTGESGRGAWSDSARRAYEQQPYKGGFRLITARIVDVRFGASWWLITDAGIAARIMPTDQAAFDRAQLPYWAGGEVELRGWMYRGAVEGERGAGWVMLLRDPAVLRRLD